MDEETLQKIRTAFLELRQIVYRQEEKIRDLERKVSGHGTLLVDLRGPDAYELHTSYNLTNDELKENL